MYYGAIKHFDIANGDGVRISLFVSGCNRKCKGCFNEEAQSFTYGKPVDEGTYLELDRALSDPNVAGLSVLGGDPFEPENRDHVKALCLFVRDRHPEKTIWVWTGYLFEDLKDLPVMKCIDVLIDGPFIENEKDLRLRWRGSSNQRVIDVKKSLTFEEVVLLEGD